MEDNRGLRRVLNGAREDDEHHNWEDTAQRGERQHTDDFRPSEMDPNQTTEVGGTGK